MSISLTVSGGGGHKPVVSQEGVANSNRLMDCSFTTSVPAASELNRAGSSDGVSPWVRASGSGDV